MDEETRIRAKYAALRPFLDERRRRLWAANEALALGRGGVTVVVAATGLARNTIRVALRSSEPPGFRCPVRPSKLDPFKDEIHALLRGDAKMPGVRVRGCSV